MENGKPYPVNRAKVPLNSMKNYSISINLLISRGDFYFVLKNQDYYQIKYY